jgi:4-hydroxy-4-methyl-2-oxoglutarate aldolase
VTKVEGMHRIVPRGIPLDPGMLARLREAGVATAHEAQGRTGLLHPAIRPIQSGVCVAGSAVTVLTRPDDNLMIHAAVEWCGPGDILVVAVERPSAYGLVGELLATALHARGVAGLVIDAGVRDVGPLRAMGFPVWSRLVSAQGATKEQPGSVNVPVECGGRHIGPGDAIVADDDGVVSIARATAAAVADRCDARTASEAEKRALFAAGTLSLDLYGLRATLDALGVVTVEPEPVDAGVGTP